MIMVINTKDILIIMVRNVDLVFVCGIMELNTMENGNIESKMELDIMSMQMVV